MRAGCGIGCVCQRERSGSAIPRVGAGLYRRQVRPGRQRRRRCSGIRCGRRRRRWRSVRHSQRRGRWSGLRRGQIHLACYRSTFAKSALRDQRRADPSCVPRKNIIQRCRWPPGIAGQRGSPLQRQSGERIIKTALFQERQGFLVRQTHIVRRRIKITRHDIGLQAVVLPVLQRVDLLDQLPGRFCAGLLPLGASALVRARRCPIAELHRKKADVLIAQPYGGEGETSGRGRGCAAVLPRFRPRQIGLGLGENRHLPAQEVGARIAEGGTDRHLVNLRLQGLGQLLASLPVSDLLQHDDIGPQFFQRLRRFLDQAFLKLVGPAIRVRHGAGLQVPGRRPDQRGLAWRG